MRRVIVQDDLREAQIRPESGFNTYIELLEKDFEAFLAQADLVQIPGCPACGHPDYQMDFQKMGIQYVECLHCRSLYASPRPKMEDLDRFYAESEAIGYWNSTIAQDTASARRQYIFGPRATWIIETSGLRHQDQGILVDFYTKYPAYLEEVAKRGSFSEILVRKPAVDLKGLFDSGVCAEVFRLEDASVSGISAFEVIERLFDPFSFLEHVNRILRPGGLVFITTLSISGFDLRLLRHRARNLLPPTHLTLLSYKGIQYLIQRSGFELIELSTPGQLDVALVLDALERDPTIEIPPVIDSILLRRGKPLHEAFQDYLQRANLSSHVWVAAVKAPAY